MIKLRLIEYEANTTGKISTIDELRNNLQNESKEKQLLVEKLLNIER